MSIRAAAWMRQADSDLLQARDSFGADRYEWACYAASQAAEKALKAGLLALGAEQVWGHNLAALLQSLSREGDFPVSADMMDDARVLTQFNIVARYPMGDEAVPPTDLMTRSQARAAVDAAVRIMEFVKTDVLPPSAP